MLCCAVVLVVADVPGSVDTPAATMGASGDVISAKRRTCPACRKLGRTARVSCKQKT